MKFRVALVVVVELAAFAAGWWLLVVPQRSDAARDTRAANAAQARLSATRPSLVPATPAGPAIALPGTADIAGALRQVRAAARAAGVTVESAAPGTPAANAVPVALVATGDLYSLTDLLGRLRELVVARHGTLEVAGRLFGVREATLTRIGGADFRATVELVAYY